jgi:hypothetical protein
MAKEKPIGVVTHWFDKLGVAVIKLSGKIATGDKVLVRRGEEEFEDTIESIQIDHKPVVSAKKGDDAAVKLTQKTKEGAEIFAVQ